MTHERAFSLLIAALLSAAPAAAGEAPGAAPKEVSASYNVYMNGLPVAVMNETFETRDSAYRIVSESTAVGILALIERNPARFVSSGRMTASGLRPEHFEGKRGEADRRRVQAEFDWQEKRLTLTHDGRTDTVALPPGTQDRLSSMYQFMFHEFDGRERLDIIMTNGRKLDSYRYTIRRDIELETALGRLKTLHLVRLSEPEETRTEIWLAPEHRFLPVRMLVEEKDGPRYEQVILKLEVKP